MTKTSTSTTAAPTLLIGTALTKAQHALSPQLRQLEEMIPGVHIEVCYTAHLGPEHREHFVDFAMAAELVQLDSMPRLAWVKSRELGATLRLRYSGPLDADEHERIMDAVNGRETARRSA